MSRVNNLPIATGVTKFSKGIVPDIDFSTMRVAPRVYTTFNAGDIVPLKCIEVLPHETRREKANFVIRQNTAIVPTMNNMLVDIYAFFVPNRVVNESWVNVMGENTSGMWTAPEVELAPLGYVNKNYNIPVGSVADYYGLPTQGVLSGIHANQMNDLVFRGYLEIYNEYFRSEAYQPPIPYSKLNVFNGFLEPVNSDIGYFGSDSLETTSINIAASSGTVADGSIGAGAIVKSLYGEGSAATQMVSPGMTISGRTTSFSALGAPLKANKYHDVFTSVTPSPQKGRDVVFGVGDSAPVTIDTATTVKKFPSNGTLQFQTITNNSGQEYRPLVLSSDYANNWYVKTEGSHTAPTGVIDSVTGSNLVGIADLSTATGITVNDLRLSAAIQQVYEALAQGSRYREFISNFFGLDTVDNFPNKPILLGKFRRNLDLYQVAQTSASQEGGTPQGNLTAYGFTDNGGDLFTHTFLEHGYVHIFCVVRHHNIYTAGLARHWFKRGQLDFYTTPLANIGNQPIYSREINAFANDKSGVFGYQEPWFEHREEFDTCTAFMRTGIPESLGEAWTLADPYDSILEFADGNWLKSNSQQVLDRTLAVTSSEAPQFNAVFEFLTEKELPMPTYSYPGLDVI